jgi:hypothetical protein
MDSKLENIVANSSVNFNAWEKIFNDHNSWYNPSSNISQDEHINQSDKVADVLAEISELYFKYGSFKDQFDNSKMSLNFYGPYVILKSTKIGVTFNLGIDNNGLYLNTFLKFPENLRHMDDSFYKDLFALTALGNFELQENESYSSQTKTKYDPLFSNQKSIFFRLIRNYVVGTAEKSRDIPLGDFNIHWPYTDDFKDIIINSCLAFKLLYRLNYSLWKIHDLQHKK